MSTLIKVRELNKNEFPPTSRIGALRVRFDEADGRHRQLDRRRDGMESELVKAVQQRNQCTVDNSSPEAFAAMMAREQLIRQTIQTWQVELQALQDTANGAERALDAAYDGYVRACSVANGETRLSLTSEERAAAVASAIAMTRA